MNNFLKRMNYYYDKVLDEIDAGVHVVDEGGNTVIYNRKMAEIEGMAKADVLYKNLHDVFSFEHNEESRLLEAVEKGIKIENAKQSYYNNQGLEITTVNHTLPIFYENERIGAMEIARDITKLEKLIRENRQQREETRFTFQSIIGHSPAISDVIEASKRATRTDSSILIIGDTGTGKELFAQSIHNASERAHRPFISQNCAAIPDNLIEGLLFGTKKGAFTGAIERPGLFEEAEGGTLLLDEINSLNIHLQAKLLRVLQEKKVRRVGDTRDRSFNVRIIATINEDPIEAITNGHLRKDLYYRLGVVSLSIPPLKERREDIEELAYHFIHKYNEKFAMGVKDIDPSLLSNFFHYEWPGNVRELEHLIEGAMNLIEYEESITYHHLPFHYRHRLQSQPFLKKEKVFDHPVDSNKHEHIGHTLNDYLTKAERHFIQQALIRNQHHITNTAKELGMSRQNLQYRIKKHRLT